MDTHLARQLPNEIITRIIREATVMDTLDYWLVVVVGAVLNRGCGYYARKALRKALLEIFEQERELDQLEAATIRRRLAAGNLTPEEEEEYREVLAEIEARQELD